MFEIRLLRDEDLETVAEMVATDQDDDLEKGYLEAIQYTLEHLETVPQHCYVVENGDKRIVSTMVLHPQKDVFEIEDFHVREVQRNSQALSLLKAKLMEYLENVQMEVLCCPYALRRLMTTDKLASARSISSLRATPSKSRIS